MTWLKFKEWVEAAGVSDSDKIWYLDISPAALRQGNGCVSICRDDDHGIYIVQGKGVPHR